MSFGLELSAVTVLVWNPVDPEPCHRPHIATASTTTARIAPTAATRARIANRFVLGAGSGAGQSPPRSGTRRGGGSGGGGTTVGLRRGSGGGGTTAGFGLAEGK